MLIQYFRSDSQSPKKGKRQSPAKRNSLSHSPKSNKYLAKNGSTDSDTEKKRKPRRKSIKKDKKTEQATRSLTTGFGKNLLL